MLLRKASLFCVFFSVAALAGQYDFLKKFEQGLPNPVREPRTVARNAEPPPLNLIMAPFYQAISHNNEIHGYVGVGVEFYVPQVGQQLLSAMQALAKAWQLDLVDWKWEHERSRLSFYDPSRGVRYFLQVGHERNEFIESFAHFPVVMYSGHSRLGRGPAFEEFSNYFRLGNIFSTIEVDTRNRYFRDEPLKKTEEFPPEGIVLEGTEYQFQYRGQKDENAHLPADSYTKVIEGGPKDFNATAFLPTPQVIFLWSCENAHYFKVPMRHKLSTQKAILFGTWGVPYHGLITPVSIFYLSLARELSTSLDIVSELNKDENVYTAY